MICSNCGKECEEFLSLSDCCNAPVDLSGSEFHDDHACPCESESIEDCKACQDIRTVEDVKAGLFTLEAVKEAMSKVGIIGYVRDRIIEELVK